MKKSGIDISKKDLIKLRNAGLSYKKIGTKYGVSDESIRQKAFIFGIAQDRSLKNEKNILKKIIKYKKKYLFDKLIAEKLNIDKQKIYLICKKYEIPVWAKDDGETFVRYTKPIYAYDEAKFGWITGPDCGDLSTWHCGQCGQTRILA